MDVATHHAVIAAALALVAHCMLVVADEIDGLLDAVLHPRGERPVAVAEFARNQLKYRLRPEQQVVADVAQERDPPVIAGNDVELIAVDHHEPLAVGGDVIGLVDDRDVAQHRARVAAQELVVVAGHVDQPGATSDQRQESPHHVVVGLRPIETRSQPPPVHDVADEVDDIAGMGLEECHELVGLASSRTEVDVREKDRPVVCLANPVFGIHPVHGRRQFQDARELRRTS